MIDDITIPDEAVEAAVAAYRAAPPGVTHASAIGIACLAMLKAWPRMDTGPNIYGRQNAIIHLPLPTENNDVEV